MPKGDKRQARKDKDRAEKRRRDAGRPKAFDPRRDKYLSALPNETAIALRGHPSLRRIEMLTQAEAALSDAELAKRYGLEDLTHVMFDIDDGGNKTEPTTLTSGGSTMFFIAPDGSKATAVFLKPAVLRLSENGAAVMLAVLFHELGHVADYERGETVIAGRPFDVVRGEYLAHVHGLRLLKERNYQAALAFWLYIVEHDQGHCGVPNIEAAAKMVVGTKLFADSRRDLAEHVDGFYDRAGHQPPSRRKQPFSI